MVSVSLWCIWHGISDYKCLDSIQYHSYEFQKHFKWKTDFCYNIPDCISYRKVPKIVRRTLKQPQESQQCSSHALLSRKKITGGMNGGLINDSTVKSLDFRRDYLFPCSLLLHNTRPVGREVLCSYSIWEYDFIINLTFRTMCFRTLYSCWSPSYYWQICLLPFLL